MDEPGKDSGGAAPFELLESALGGCTNMTIRLVCCQYVLSDFILFLRREQYADLKKLPLTGVSTLVTHSKDGAKNVFKREITLQGSGCLVLPS